MFSSFLALYNNKVMALDLPKIFRKIEVLAFIYQKQREKKKCGLSLRKAE